MKKIILMIFLILIISSCENVEEKNKENKTEIKKEIKLANYEIEKEDFLKKEKASFNIRLKNKITEKEKASFNIRLKNKITEKEIENIANKIKNDNPGFERYFIMYYLEGMKIDNGAWATSNFNPNLKINILGMTEKEEKNSNSNLPKGEIIGKWIDNGVLGNTKIIYKENNKLKLREIYKDGSFGDKELTKNGNIYNFESDFGEYYKIEENGNLGLYGESGKFDEISKLK